VGDYSLECVFINNSRRAWYEATGGGELGATVLGNPVPLGELGIREAKPKD